VTLGILLSRLVGLVRQRVAAHYFGTSVLADVLAAAFRVGNITQNLLGEGTLSASFIPVYAKLRGEGRPREASHFALSSLGLLLATVAVVSALGVAAAPWLTWLIAAGFEADKLASTARVVRIVFPMTGLLVISAWGLGVLNSHRRFFLPYAAPVLWSGAQIAALLVLGSGRGMRGEPLAIGLAWGALIGAALQVAVLLPAARALLGGLLPRIDLRDPAVREAARRLPGALVGRGVIQLSGLVDTFLVSFLGSGANAVFGYAQTICLLPMALLSTGEAAVALPEIAGDTADADITRRNAIVRDRLGASFARLTALTIPTTLAFALFGRELITLLLQTGSFDRAATARVEPVLAAYSLALLGNASGRVLITTSYALGDTRTPARYAVYRVVVSFVVALVLMRWLDVMGVVLGAVAAAWVETVALAHLVRKSVGGLGLARVRLGRIALLGALCCGAGFGTRAILPEPTAGSPLGALLILGAFGVTFLVGATLLGVMDIRSLGRRR